MKPMLAETVKDVESLNYPLYASPKLDGIRCTLHNGEALSRSLKLIPNVSIQERLRELASKIGHGLDGELTVGSPSAPDVYLKTVSAVMSQEGEPDFTFRVFDKFDCPDLDFTYRLERADRAVETYKSKYKQQPGMEVVSHTHTIIHDSANLLEYEEAVLAIGYEGLILRSPEGKYKYGRSTLKQGWMLKLKRFVDAEAVICGFEELMHNDNEAFENELGHTARSTNAENLVPSGTLGALKVEDADTAVPFKIGTGFDAGMRELIWNNRHDMLGKIVKYKHFPVGAKTAPRHPVFIGFRSKDDMG